MVDSGGFYIVYKNYMDFERLYVIHESKSLLSSGQSITAVQKGIFGDDR
jgi:hypothetical protein